MAKNIREIKKILVANRGEIAIRVIRSATELGIRTATIFSEEDKLSLHRYKADEAYMVGKGQGPLRPYLGIDEIVTLALEKEIDAIHPGYGFLAENEEFAKACEKAGIIFVGPPHHLIAQMGDKLEAKKLAKKYGLPVVPGTSGPVNLNGAKAFAKKAGFPVIIKAAYGGGGRGMRLAHNEKDLTNLFNEAVNESKNAFGRAEVFVEKYISRPKHIEVQILGDHHGHIVHCYERDCSIQRRHQKVVEIAPAPCFLSSEKGKQKQKEIYEAATLLARKIGYVNAGTIEFLYEPKSGHFYFMEMNTRIQVEHTVTEMCTGLDLVRLQILIAQGYQLSDKEIGFSNQSKIKLNGVAIQCRLTTEDPSNNFTPDYGRLNVYRSSAGPGVRLDAGSAHPGAVITPFYDSLLVKVTAWSRNLAEASRRMDRALAEFRIRGVKSNILFLRSIAYKV